ncbi:MAG: acylglycerol kinase family protein, partial [Firmicutes bacterium]|nr:acylglycerol kinase family protein [Bacillota bacterium]
MFIYNPTAGKGKVKKHLALIIGRLEQIFGSVTVKETLQEGDAARFASQACGVYEYLIFSGGDGTFNEVVNGIAEAENRPILGYIPQGTTNDIASNFGLSKKVKKALDTIQLKKNTHADIIKVTHTDSQVSSYAA